MSGNFDLDDNDLDYALARIETELDILQSLREELHELGSKAARLQAARAVSFAEALYDSMPDGCRIAGQVWGELERGFRDQWEQLQ
jgi:hypothetical protein